MFTSNGHLNVDLFRDVKKTEGTDQLKFCIFKNSAHIDWCGRNRFILPYSVVGVRESEQLYSDTDFDVLYFTPQFMARSLTYDILYKPELQEISERHFNLQLILFTDRTTENSGIHECNPYVFSYIQKRLDIIHQMIKENFWPCNIRSNFMDINSVVSESVSTGNIVGLDENSARILYYIHANYHKGLTTEIIMDEFKIQKNELYMIFNRIVGIPFKHYILEMQLNKACRDLAFTSISISDISMSCGFYDSAHFIKTFKSHFNMGPELYRNKAVTSRKTLQMQAS